jgi:hypothetical protein
MLEGDLAMKTIFSMLLISVVLTVGFSLPVFACGQAASMTNASGSQSSVSESATDEAVSVLTDMNAVRACHDEINCPPGDQCLGGTCVFQGQCHADVDCGAGRHCSGGNCH